MKHVRRGVLRGSSCGALGHGACGTQPMHGRSCSHQLSCAHQAEGAVRLDVRLAPAARGIPVNDLRGRGRYHLARRRQPGADGEEPRARRTSRAGSEDPAREILLYKEKAGSPFPSPDPRRQRGGTHQHMIREVPAESERLGSRNLSQLLASLDHKI